VIEPEPGMSASWAIPVHTIPFALWPITAHSYWLRLHGSMTSEEVGTALYRLVCWNKNSEDPELPHSAAAAVDVLVDQDVLYVPGGLLLHDPVSGVTAEPGCCSGIEDWRDWVAALSGHIVDLGHEPAPLLEHRAGVGSCRGHGPAWRSARGFRTRGAAGHAAQRTA
jgi:hypothetical protein